jgi:hypothetical protein
MVDRRDGALWLADPTVRGPQAIERLWRRHLMHEVEVNIKEGRLVVWRADDVGIP